MELTGEVCCNLKFTKEIFNLLLVNAVEREKLRRDGKNYAGTRSRVEGDLLTNYENAI